MTNKSIKVLFRNNINLIYKFDLYLIDVLSSIRFSRKNYTRSVTYLHFQFKVKHFFIIKICNLDMILLFLSVPIT